MKATMKRGVSAAKTALAQRLLRWGWKLIGVQPSLGVMVLPNGKRIEF